MIDAHGSVILVPMALVVAPRLYRLRRYLSSGIVWNREEKLNAQNHSRFGSRFSNDNLQ